ncbi:MAG: hypothetical protein R3D63_14645 [Paracoccaceae bacterium]
MKRLFLALPVLLAACGTPQEQCIAAGTRDLRVVNRLIAEAETNLSRGYALEEHTIRVPTFSPCRAATPPGAPPAPVRMCPDHYDRTVTRPKAIDLDAEARKLAQLQDKRKQLLRQAEAVTAQCKAEYPE